MWNPDVHIYSRRFSPRTLDSSTQLYTQFYMSQHVVTLQSANRSDEINTSNEI